MTQTKTGSPVSDFKRFEELVTVVSEGREEEKLAALGELAEDLANLEVLVKVSYFLATEGERAEYYDAVWKDEE